MIGFNKKEMIMQLTKNMKKSAVLDYYTKGQDGRYGDIIDRVMELLKRIDEDRLTEMDNAFIWMMYYDKI